jgi:hypothetical protein
MSQGNFGYALTPSTNFTPGAATGASGPAIGYVPITLVMVTQGGAATLDYFDQAGNQLTISLGTVNNPTMFPITLTRTGSALTSGRFYGFSVGNPNYAI